MAITSPIANTIAMPATINAILFHDFGEDWGEFTTATFL